MGCSSSRLRGSSQIDELANRSFYNRDPNYSRLPQYSTRVSDTSLGSLTSPNQTTQSDVRYIEPITPRSILNQWVELAPNRVNKAARENLRDTLLRQQVSLSKKGDLLVSGNLNLCRSTDLTSLPDNLEIIGNLQLSNSAQLTSLPKNLRVSGALYANRCTALTSIPDDLQVGGTLDLNSCIALNVLPNNLRVGRNLYLNGCTSLTALPDSLQQVNGSLCLRQCTALNTLPDNLRVVHNLDLSGCTALNQLPNTLWVGGSLDLRRCTSLTSLPNNLHIGDRLDLVRCRVLTTLPDNLDIGGDIDLGHCTSLTSLPNAITSLGFTHRGAVREINIAGSGISESVRQQLQNSVAPGTLFFFDHAPTLLQHDNISLPEALSRWDIESTLLDNTQLTGDQTEDLIRYLSRLQNTADAQSQNTRTLLKSRVETLIHNIIVDKDDFKSIALSTINVGLTSCDDRIILALNDIEIAISTREAESSKNPKKALTAMAKALFARECIHQEADRLASRPGFVDPLEVYLTLEIALQKEFNLPGQTQTMLFRSCANVSNTDIEQVKQYTQKQLNNGPAFKQFISTYEPLIELNRREAIQSFDIAALSTITLQAAGLQEESRCLITGESYMELAKRDADIIVLAYGDHQYSIFDKPSLLNDWANRGRSIISGKEVSLEEYRALMFKLPDSELTD